jgi:tRNA (guanine-N7-)-methyltransferase
MGPLENLAQVFPDLPSGSPVELEIGFGKGLHLVNASQSNPQTRYLGIEIERKYVLFAATTLVKNGIRNVRLVTGDATIFVANHVPKAILDVVHIYFPDPWWKKRHHKRRLVTLAFLNQVLDLLKPGGLIRFATDVEAYFQMTEELLPELKGVSRSTPVSADTPNHDMDYLTHFERKARLKGKPIFRWDLKKMV